MGHRPGRSGADRETGQPAPDVTLTNGHYSVLVTPRGTGFSAWCDQIVTTWSGDRLEARDGLVLYIRDRDAGEFWPAEAGPAGEITEAKRPPLAGAPTGAAGAVTIRGTRREIAFHLEIRVEPDRDAERRILTLANRSDRPRRLDITSYAEIVLTDRGAWLAHPEFCRLFVQTGYDPATGALLAWRRPRSPGERHPYLAHAIIASDPPGTPGGPGADRAASPPEYETDRTRFIGRGHDPAAPAALLAAGPLSRTTGNVLDPIVSLRQAVTLEPGGETALTFVLAAAPERDQVLSIVRALAGWRAVARAEP